MSNDNGVSLSKDELIQKLQKISKLCDNVIEIKGEIDNFVPQDNYPRKILVPIFPGEYENENERNALKSTIVHTDDNAIDQMSDTYDHLYHPKKPSKPKIPTYRGADTSKSKEKQGKFSIISNIGLGVAIFFILGAIFGTSGYPETLPKILTIAGIGAAAFGVGRLLCMKEKKIENKIEAEAKAKYNEEVAALNEQYKNKMKHYEDQCNAYVKIRQAFLKEYADWREIYLESVAEENKISELLEADRQAAVDKIYEEKMTPVMREFEETNDILSMDYLPAVNTLIDLLKSGRADDLKEAINLYEDMVYRERQLQLEREKEDQRRREEELRRQDEERRYQEDKAFREEQERQRQYEEERRERQLERRHQEEMQQRERQERDRQLEEQRRRDEEQRRRDEEQRQRDREELDRKRKELNATSQQCLRCALNNHCSLAFKRPNCASFRPQ